MTPFFPIALKLVGRRCLVVGTGDEADARSNALRAAGADVTCVPSFEPSDLDGVWLAVLATRDLELARAIDRECEERRIFFAAVDEPSVGSYSHLALARAGNVTAAIGTNGEAPALARRLREVLAELFSRANLAEFADKHAALRRATPPAERRAVLGADVQSLRIDGELVVPKRPQS